MAHLTVLARAVSVAVTVSTAAVATAADEKVLDLSHLGQRQEQVRPGTYHLKIRNRAPRVAYVISVGLEPRYLEPLDAGVLERAPAPAPNPNCGPLEEAVNRLTSLTLKETDVPATVAAVEHQLKALGKVCPEYVSSALAALRMTTEDLGTRDLPPDHILTLTVKRQDEAPGGAADQKDTVTWTLALETAPPGRWYATFGFSFAWDRDQRYYSKAAEDGTFTVVKEPAPTGPAYIPTVYFGWISASQIGRQWQHSPVGGIGFDQNNPAIFAGYSLTFRQNLSLIGAVGAAKFKDLAGTYREGQSLEELLQPDSLMRDRYDWTAAVALAFRFGANPFKAPESAQVADKGGDGVRRRPGERAGRPPHSLRFP
jgi:hypothetical protein